MLPICLYSFTSASVGQSEGGGSLNKHLDRWFTVVLILLLAACLLLTVEDLLVYAAPYDVKIDARDSENGWIAVRIAMNGVDTGSILLIPS